MRAWLFCLLVLSPLGVQAGEADEYVLVWENAWLHQAPRADAPGIRELAFPDSERATRRVEARVFRLLGERGGWLEVEVAQDPDSQHCANPLYELSAFGLRFFVRSRDLAPVLEEEFTQTYSDGSRLRLKAGLPLGPNDRAGLHRIRFGGLDFAVALPGDKVGRSYRPLGKTYPGCAAKWNLEDSRLSLDSGKPVELNEDGHVCVEAAGSKRWRLRKSCVELEVYAEPRPKPRQKQSRSNILGALGSGGAGYSLRQDAAVFWPDGKRAGRMRRAFWLPEKSLEPVDDSGLRCTTRQVYASGRKDAAPEAERRLRLCFRPTDLVKAERAKP